MSDHVILLSVPGLRATDLAAMPNLSRLVSGSERATLTASFPCVTWPVQANMLTGKRPAEHGVVANGFFWRDKHEVEMWTAWNEKIQQPQIWDLLHQRDPSLKSAVWFPMLSKGCGADHICMPAPIHNPDGSESLWCYTKPVELYGTLRDTFGHFPLMNFWGPMANIKSTAWIADSAAWAMQQFRPNFFYIYLPHLDYAAQKTGPDSPAAQAAVKELDDVLGKLVANGSAAYQGKDVTWIVASEYAITPVDHVTYPNRVLRQAGLLTVKEEGGELIDFSRTPAWALVDHQFSHVFVKDRDAATIGRVVDLFRKQEGIAEVLAGSERKKYAIDHERTGDVVLISTPNSWQAYYYWLNDAKAPKFARTVDIHNKPGYDPVELHFDFATKSIPLDATLIKGSHGAPAVNESQRGVLLSSQRGAFGGESMADVDVCNIVLRLLGCVLFSIGLALFGGCGAQAIKEEQIATSKAASIVASHVAAEASQQAEAKVLPNATAEKVQSAEAVAPAAINTKATDNEVRQPATVAEATKAIDLSTFPLMPGAKEPGMRVVASLGYEAAGDVKTVFEFQRRSLLERKWKELSEPQIYDQSASGQFGREGYHVSVSVFPRGEAGQVSVRLQNHSNLNLGKLPAPPGTKFQYAFPGVASFETAVAVEETVAAVRKLLLDQGWQPYGSAGDVMSFKQNAVQLNARVLAPPAQPGKTVISYSAVQMSADLPAPGDAEHVQYSDQLKQLNMHALGTPDEVAAYYQTMLAPAGWQSTTKKPVNDGVESFMIFRNAEKELLNLNMWDLRQEKKTRVTLNHQSAAEVEELDRLATLAIEEKKKKAEAERNKPKPKATVSLPEGAQDVQAKKEEIEFHVATGKGKVAVEAIVKQLAAAGWKLEDPVGDNMAGQLSLQKDGQSIKILYIDPGFIPVQITISGWGVELERAGAEKE